MDWLSIVALGATLFAVTDGSPWAPWTTSVPIVLPAGGAIGYARLTLEPAFDATPDLRVVDQNGSERAYVTDPDEHRPSGGAQREIPITGAEFIPGGFTQAVLDFGLPATVHSAVALDGGREAFFDRVRVEASSDAKTWTLIRKDAYIYRIASDRSGNTIVSFPPTRDRYLRLQILDSQSKFPLTGWSVSWLPPQRGDTLLPRSGNFSIVSAGASNKQTWTADFGRPVAACAVEFLNPITAFSRTAVVEAGPNGTDWHDAGSGPIANYTSGAPQTAFAFAEQRARFWRVSIDNGSREALRDLMPRLLTRPHDLLFEPELNHSYVMLAGNDLASPPSYDLASKLDREDWSAKIATLGPAASNVAFEEAKPIFERYPWLLTAGAIVGALGLAILALRIVRPRPRPKDVFEPPPK